MALIFVSLQSAHNWKGALGIFDPASGLRYLQIDTPSPLVRNSHPRGVAVLDDRLYVNTSASIRIYRLDERKGNPLLRLDKEVVLNEWLLGENMQANLVSLAASRERKRLFVGNTSFCSVDELDLEGMLIHRHHLWEIAPDLFPMPGSAEKKVVYALFRNLCLAANGEVCLTLANCNNSGFGKVISLETGEELIGGLHDPHDGLFGRDLYYLHDIDQGRYQDNEHSGRLCAYRVAKERTIFGDQAAWAVRPAIDDGRFPDSIQNLRGMALDGESLYCGVTHYGQSSDRQIASRVVAFHAASGRQQREYLLPDLAMLREPRVLFMAALAENVTLQWRQDLYCVVNSQSVPPELFGEENKKSATAQGGDSSAAEPGTTSTAESAGPATAATQFGAAVGGAEGFPAALHKAAGQEGALAGDKGAGAQGAQSPPDPAKTARPEGAVQNGSVQWIKAEGVQEKARVPSVILTDVTLRYRRTASFAFFSSHSRLGKAADFLAIDRISFTIYENETVGLIGRNGSGKSTISMIISGALPPDSGRVQVHGKVQLLALGVGFRPELTGRENVYISGTLLGMTRRQVTERMGEIEAFAELGDFFDEPLRIYSSGMRSRLGFAVATAVNPDILILDEIMSTGDAAFRNKADRRMQEMRERTKTVLMVSHSSEQLKNLCSRVIWLEKGRLLMDGAAVPVLAEYTKFCKDPGKWLAGRRGSVAVPA